LIKKYDSIPVDVITPLIKKKDADYDPFDLAEEKIIPNLSSPRSLKTFT
jgi:hypothetical protein